MEETSKSEPTLIWALLDQLRENNKRFRSGEFDLSQYRSEQLSVLNRIDSADPVWYQVWASQPESFGFPIRFVVDSDLERITRAELDPSIPALFNRVIEEIRDGRLNIQKLGLVLQKLARRSTREQFGWYRSVLDRTVVLPCSPKLWNEAAPEQFKFPLPKLPRIKQFVGTNLEFPLQALVIEGYDDKPLRFIESDRAYDSDLEPDPQYAGRIRIPNRTVQIFANPDKLILRDIGGPEPLMERIELTEQFWVDMTNRVWLHDRAVASPKFLLDFIKVLREQKYLGFTVVLSDDSGIAVRFDRNPRIELRDSIKIELDR